MHLIEFKNAKYFEKDILPYCIIQSPLKKFQFPGNNRENNGTLFLKNSLFVKNPPLPPPPPPMSEPIKLGNYATNFSSNTATETNSL